MAANPYDAPSASVPQGSLWPNEHEGEVVIVDRTMSKSTWTLRFHKQSVELVNSEGTVVQSAEKAKFLKDFTFAPIGTKCLVAKLGKTKKAIKLTDETVLGIIRLLGIEDWKREYAKISSKGMLTWGAILLGLSILVMIGTERWTLDLILLEALWFLAGCVMIINGFLAKKSLRPRNYILQLISSSALLLCIGINIITAFHWLQVVFFAVVFVGIPLAIGNYRLFMALERETKGG